MNKLLLDYKDFLFARKLSLNYFEILRVFFAFLEKNNIDYQNLSQQNITNFFNEHPNYLENTRTQYIKAGRHFDYYFLQIPKEQSQWYKIRYFIFHRRKPKFLSPKELQFIIKQYKIYENHLASPLKAEAFIKFMYYTGLRKAEILSLKRSDIDFSSNPCKIRVIGKGNKERFVYFSEKFSPRFVKLLQSYFSSETEKENAFNFTLDKLNYFVNKMNKYLKDKKITPHLFRHSFGKYLSSKGVSIQHIQKLYGHSSLATTMIYLDPTEEEIINNFKE